MSKCRRYKKRKIINIILENHFEKFKQYKLPSIKSKEILQHIINVIEKALNCGNIEHGAGMMKLKDTGFNQFANNENTEFRDYDVKALKNNREIISVLEQMGQQKKKKRK